VNGSASCTLCSTTHSTNGATGLTSCTGCSSGYFGLNNNNCNGKKRNRPSFVFPFSLPQNLRLMMVIACNGGSYCSGGTTSPVSCGTNAWSLAGSSSLSNCFCLLGSSGNPSSGGCTLCGSGSYSAVNGSASCTSCTNGATTIASSGSTRCDACNAGNITPFLCCTKGTLTRSLL
jgi:hypothetical protein